MSPAKLLITAAIVMAGGVSTALIIKREPKALPPAAECTNAGLSLPPGFCATVFADGLGHARHIAVAEDGTVYTNVWADGPFRNDPPPAGGFLVALRDLDGDGRADRVERFGSTAAGGSKGGTGIAIYKGQLFAEVDGTIVRYPLTPGTLAPAGAPVVILRNLPLDGFHSMHPFIIDRNGALFVSSGSATNACETVNGKPETPGRQPCEELSTRAGIWRYSADKTDQHFSPAERFSTGLRNSMGLAVDASGRLYATQHGRDQLFQNWPRLYSAGQGAELPAEELVTPIEGGDYGWPQCYYDEFQKRLVLAPEYGGDGGKTIGICATRQPPIAAFPGHWAPNDLLIYSGRQFPLAYRGGAFIAFHGSWNRAPAPQGGYNITFQPLANGKANGPSVLFADGFAGRYKEPGRATARPAGLAMGPDGALYIADDVRGRIWRVTYRGPENTPLAAAAPATVANDVAPPDGKAKSAQNSKSTLTPPPGFTAAQLALGDRIFHGEEKNGTCSGCHGSDTRGSPVGPNLIGAGLWADGSMASIRKVIVEGVAKPKRYPAAMPPTGGSSLKPDEIDAVTAYVWAMQHSSR